MRNKNEIEEIENTEEMQNITVQLLNIAGDVKKYEDVKFIKIKSKKYNLIIMKDYLPIIGEIQGEIEIGREKENIEDEETEFLENFINNTRLKGIENMVQIGLDDFLIASISTYKNNKRVISQVL